MVSPIPTAERQVASSKKQVSTVNTSPNTSSPPADPLSSESQLERTMQVVKQVAVLTPNESASLESALESMPEAGDEFLGFRLLSELGRGAFGRVFLAQQMELADRPVALKIAPEVARESDRLARLQHTNIVPIHSVYLRGRLQAICMPYLGANTIRHVINALREWRKKPDAPAALIKQHFLARGYDEIAGVLSIAARLSEALIHAHERHILHLDLKPTNVLFNDDGQPMLLDFNLAQHTIQLSSAAVGGTFPYMPPEQLRSLSEKTYAVDERTDLYSLGVILYELLTGEAPFPNHPSLSMRERVQVMLKDRQRTLTNIRRSNPRVSPAVEAIVLKLLAPEPANRYQSARELHEDIQRQLNHQPLRHAPNTPRERWTKLRRRYPRLTSTVSLAVLSLVLVGTLTSALIARTNSLARYEARAGVRQLEQDRREVEFLLTGLTGAKRVEQSLAQADATLVRAANTRLVRLPDAEQQQAKAYLAEVLYLSAYGHSLKAKQNSQAKEQSLATAQKHLNELQALRGEQPLPRAVVLLQAELEQLRGQTDEARRLKQHANQVPATTGRDLHLLGVAAFQNSELVEAIRHLEESLRQDPSNFNAWFLLGVCRDARGEAREAAGIFSTCIALQPQFYSSYFNRGLAYLHMGRLVEARYDLSECIRLKPDFGDAYLNRSLTFTRPDELADAEADLTKAIELEPHSSRLHLLRSRVRAKRQDQTGATADRELGLKLTPVEPVDWVTRGLAQLPANPAAALADYEEALKRDPKYLPALQNKGSLLIRYLKQTDASIDVLSKTIELYPDDARPRAGRGVLLARQGKRQQAIDDAEVALSLDSSPANRYQVAGIYALTSKTHPEDASEAFRLLGAALRQGFGFDLLDKDRDLDPIRPHPRFERTIRQARDRQPHD